jgi:hypothetical protein
MKRYIRYYSLVLFLIIFVALATAAYADVPNTINYQGRLTDDTGQPITGTKNLKFKIYGSQFGDDSLWSSGMRSVDIEDGLFNYQLGLHVALPSDLFTGNNYRYLGITVETDAEITPRIQFITAPYAMHAAVADQAATDADWTISGDDIYHETGNVGIGNTAPTERLVVGKDLGGTGYEYIVVGNDEADRGSGIKMGEDGTHHATIIWGNNDNELDISTRNGGGYKTGLSLKDGYAGIGTYATTEAALTINKQFSGVNWRYGINCTATNPDDGTFIVGMFGTGTATGTGTVSYGVYGQGFSEYGSRYGVYGLGTDPNGSSSTEGNSYGGYFKGSSNELAYGVYAMGVSSSSRIGVYGASGSGSTTNYGVYSYGNLLVTGSISKAGGGYKIDHPLDPENMYLQHSDVSSPEMKDVYDGVVTLDADGTAIVELPSYFESLNRDFRYQLTCVGGYAPVYIANKIINNRFEIAGGTPGLEVCWQVTGIRDDAFAKAKSMQVEIPKDADERGLYQNPELFGHGQDKSVDYKYNKDALEANNIPR